MQSPRLRRPTSQPSTTSTDIINVEYLVPERSNLLLNKLEKKGWLHVSRQRIRDLKRKQLRQARLEERKKARRLRLGKMSSQGKGAEGVTKDAGFQEKQAIEGLKHVDGLGTWNRMPSDQESWPHLRRSSSLESDISTQDTWELSHEGQMNDASEKKTEESGSTKTYESDASDYANLTTDDEEEGGEGGGGGSGLHKSKRERLKEMYEKPILVEVAPLQEMVIKRIAGDIGLIDNENSPIKNCLCALPESLVEMLLLETLQQGNLSCRNAEWFRRSDHELVVKFINEKYDKFHAIRPPVQQSCRPPR